MRREIRPQDQSTIKYNNTKMILDLIRKSPGVSRSEMARITGMSPTSVTRIVGDLQELDLVRETSVVSGGLGRKAVNIELNRSRFYAVGVDISEGELTICVQNTGGELAGKLSDPPTSRKRSGPEVVERLHDMYLRLLAQCNIDDSQVATIGAGTIGTVDVETGMVVYADLLRWNNVPIGSMIAERFGKPTFVDNDVKCALFGEITAEGGRAASDTVLLSIGKGVGAAIMHNSRMLRGVANSAGEIGHTIVDYTDGRLCICGRRGCVAAFLTEERILEHVQQAFPDVADLEQFMKAFRNDEPWAITQVERICSYISITISNTVCFVNPSTVILGGKLLTEYPELYDLSIAKYNGMRYEPLRSTVFKRTLLKKDGTCVGGAYLATELYIQKMLQAPPSR